VKDRPEVLFSEERIRQRVAELGVEVAGVFEGKELTMVGLMKSCMLFMSDLVRAEPLDVTCHFMRATTLREVGSGPLRTDIIYTAEMASVEGKDLMLLADVVDTGITLNFLLDHLRERHPASLRVATIIDKPGERKIDVHPDWALFTLAEPTERFLVGYGLDYNEFYRGLPYIGTIPRPEPADGRKPSLTPGSMQ
jgi:hypoxanthine phosphoribosyltransferase